MVDLLAAKDSPGELGSVFVIYLFSRNQYSLRRAVLCKAFLCFLKDTFNGIKIC